MKQYSLTTKRITDVPFHYLTTPETSHLLLGLEKYSDWLLPQALEAVHSRLLLARTPEGRIDAEATIDKTRTALGSEDFRWFGGLIMYLTRPIRKEIIGSLVQIKNPNYSVLVPLVLAALKIYRGVGYEEWDFTNPHIRHFIEAPLLKAALVNVDFSVEKLLAYREHSRVVQTGKTAGNIKELTHTVKILNTGDKEFDALPSLAKIMKCQVWVAHPSIRSSLMILQTPNLDSLPDPLVEEAPKLETITYEKQDSSIWN